jgi:GNAT superfamily N-acetyltransferase
MAQPPRDPPDLTVAGGPAVTFRSATPRDTVAVAELVHAGLETYRAFAPPGWSPNPPIQQEPEIHQRLSRDNVRSRLALDGIRAVGITGWMPAAAVPRLAHLWLLFVAPAAWGTGVADSLLTWAVDGMRESGFHAGQLWTPTAQARARAFYERHGWRSTGETQFSPELELELVRYLIDL